MNKAITRVAIVTASLGIGGAEKVVTDIACAFDRSRYELLVVVHSARRDNQFVRMLTEAGIRIEFLDFTSRLSLKNYRRLSAVLKKFDPDVIHSHLDMVYASLWAHRHKKPFLFTIHSQPHRLFGKKSMIRLYRWYLKRKNMRLTAVSSTIAEEALEILRVPDECVRVVYNPVLVPREPIMREKGSVVTFINVARFNPIKNHALLLEAFAMLCRERAELHLLLAGEGELQEQCRDLVQAEGLSDKVTFLGNVFDVSAQLQQADVFVLSSNSEALPISILEAMAQSLPIISTAVGGVPEIVNMKNGRLCEKGSAVALCSAMRELADSHELRCAMGRASFESVQRFHLAQIASEYAKLYREIQQT